MSNQQASTTSDNVYLNILLTATYMYQCLDYLEGTPYYKRELKYSVKNFVKQLRPIVKDDLPLICDIEDGAMIDCMDYQEKVIAAIAGLKAEDCGVVLEFIKDYIKKPDEVLMKLGIEKVEAGTRELQPLKWG